MRHPISPIATIAFCLVLEAMCLGGTAHAQNGPATQFLKQKYQAVAAALHQPPGHARTARLSQIVGQLIDFETISKEALGAHWSERTPAQRQQFVTLLEQLVQRSYQGSVEQTLDYDIHYGAEERHGERVVVRLTARSRRNRRAPEVNIDYTLEHDDHGFRVVDITTDGVSMVDNYRSQFARIIRRDGWNGLIQKMQSRLAQPAETP